MDCPIPLRPIQLSTDYYTSERSNGIGNCGSLYSPFDKDVKMDANAKRDRLTTIQPIATTTTSINTSFVNETALPAEILLEIFNHPKMTDTLSWANFILALTRKKKSFIYGDFVKSIDISKECSMDYMKVQNFCKRLTSLSHARTSTPGLYDIIDANSNTDANTQTDYVSIASYEFSEQQNMTGHPISSLPPVESNITVTPALSSATSTYEEDPPTFVILTTSSLLQLSRNCKNLTCLNLSFTSLLQDRYIVETGEFYYSSSRRSITDSILRTGGSKMRSHIFNDSRESLLPRRNATELTCIKIHVEEAIQSFGENCPHLEEVIVRHCEWVTARIIWLFAKHCSNLVKLDARGAARCAVKRLTSRVLEASPPVMDSIGTIDATEPEVALRHPFNNFILVEAVEILEEQQGIDWPDLRYESRPGNDSFNSNTFGYIVVHNKNALDIIRSRHISPESIQTLTPATVFRANKETGGFDVLQMSFKYSDLLKYRIAPVSQVPKVYRNQFHNHTSLKHIIFEILKTAKQACVTDLSWFKDESED